MALTFEQQRTNAEKIADAALRERVLRGIEVLRSEYGDDWTDHVDALALNLRDAKLCVLGQLEKHRSGEGNYFSTALVLIDGLVEDSPEEYGFNVTDPCMDGDDYDRALAAEYAALTEAWRAVLVG